VSSEIATSVPERAVRRARATSRQARAAAVQLLGPLTMLGGAVWAIAQPYRVFLRPEGKGAYDYVFQAPVLVVAVGLLFSVVITPGLVADLGQDEDGSAA
jgi:hypothetical protein